MLHIVVADDDPGLRNAVRASLEIEKHHVYTAADGALGWRLVEMLMTQGVPVALLVTDVDMPVMNGGELTAKVKETYPSLKVLMMSGREFPEEAKADGYIAKPFSPAEFTAHVRALVQAAT